MSLNIQPNASLYRHNTMAVPARAKFLAVVSDVDAMCDALEFARSGNLSVLILGQGSNTLFTQDYDGLVILNRIYGLKVVKDKPESVIVKVASGENWHSFVGSSISRGWFGLENLALIPGLVGATPIQNIGAYGVEVKDWLISLEYIDIASGELISVSRGRCDFGYRDSVFKNSLAGKTAITCVSFELSKVEHPNLSYPALATAVKNFSKPTAKDVYQAVCAIRNRKLPLPAEVPNTGSFFKNPLINADQHQRLKNEFPQLISFPVGDHFKVAAAWMIEYAGWKNKTIDQVSVHPAHALVITNPCGVNGKHVLRYAQAIQADITRKFQINLEIEPYLV